MKVCWLVRRLEVNRHITGYTKFARDQEEKSDFLLDVTEKLLDNLV
jgi:hypothetical protein